MDMQKMVDGYLGKLDPRVATRLYDVAKKIPYVKKMVDQEYDTIMQDIESSIKPYRGKYPSYHELPQTGLPHDSILQEMQELWDIEEAKWKEGFVSGAVYHGDSQHVDFLNRVYAINSQSNPLHSDVWPSTSKYEAEIISMTAHMLGAQANADAKNCICGAVSSGGTESILLAMKAYRDWALQTKGIKRPEMVIPSTAHAAFQKASQYFRIKLRQIPVGKDLRADVRAMKRAVNRNTIVLVGSAPNFPHGLVDPIAELSSFAQKKRIGFHTDACLGGFVLPWARKLGYDIPDFDFSLPGVTSISADTHKYGYAAKGTSVILYRGYDLRHYQYYKTTDWPGGLYFSPTFAGSRPGALSAACWASLVATGQEGYLDATRKIMETADIIKNGMAKIPELQFMGQPLWVIAFGSRQLDIYRVMDFMTKRGWSLNGLHKPACVHFCVTLRHTQEGVAQRFVEDLQAAVAHVKQSPQEKGGMAPVYGLAATIPVRSVVGELLQRYMDKLYEV